MYIDTPAARRARWVEEIRSYAAHDRLGTKALHFRDGTKCVMGIAADIYIRETNLAHWSWGDGHCNLAVFVQRRPPHGANESSRAEVSREVLAYFGIDQGHSTTLTVRNDHDFSPEELIEFIERIGVTE
jgi:hypothetical protein